MLSLSLLLLVLIVVGRIRMVGGTVRCGGRFKLRPAGERAGGIVGSIGT